ncbi:lipoprotein YerB [Bacillaceae bacterium SAS-127]|nr:lipoprotein YerB [Bacillaceae bacterium SAS-127]
MRKLTIMTLLTSAILLSGCWGQKENNEAQKENGVDFPAGEGNYVSPLTGKKTEEKPNQRATAVVINNHPKARPQTGLAQADIVYEVMVEGNMTRFLAIYQSQQPEKIGPVRSARDYVIDLANGYDSLFIAHGYSPVAKEILQSGEIDQINGIQYEGTIFQRDPSRVAPHNSYMIFDEMNEVAKEKGYDLETPPDSLNFMKKAEVKELAGQEAETVHIRYSNQPAFQVEYKYDTEQQSYERWTSGEQELDRETQEPVLADNIFIIEAGHRVVDSEGRLDIDLSSGGSAYLIQRGIVRQAEWSNVNGRIIPFKKGSMLDFIPGKTWIQVIPASKGLNQIVEFAK